MDPVGPLPPSVYWRRRLIILAVVLVVLLLLTRACGVWGGNASSSTPAPTATPTASKTATPTRSATPTTKPTATSAAIKACTDSQVRVFARPAKTQNPVGGPVQIDFVVTTGSDTACTRDVGSAKDEVVITSDGRRIWSSDDCNPGGEPDVRRISKSEPFSVTVTWDGSVSQKGCPSPRSKAPAGSYLSTGRNGDVTGPGSAFTLG
jgi:hypothetical protein